MPVTIISDGRIPRILPVEVVQAVARCVCCPEGSGSGSGSGGDTGLVNCCGCFSFPDTLAFSLTIGCIGTKAGVLTKDSQLSGECIDNPDDVVRVAYSFTETNGITEDFWNVINCANGQGVSGSGGFIEDWSIELACCPRDEGMTPFKKWYFRINADKITGGQRYHVTWNGKIDVVSCAPVMFESLDESVVCNNAITLIGICGADPFGDYYDLPSTPYTNCVGSSFQFDVG